MYVGLGGNEGSEDALLERLSAAADAVAALPYAHELERSAVYLSAPQGPLRDQPPFLNAVIAFGRGADVDPVAVLADLLAIEARLGRDRDREVRFGPRPIDLDLLLCGDLVARVPGPPPLEVPHPRLGERAFALAPLAELAGYDLRLPGLEVTVGERLADPAVRAQPISRLPARW
jgi:2-amino-4-hydroxy-6-hydroxymethyldihydropteridine diphosphokinase